MKNDQATEGAQELLPAPKPNKEDEDSESPIHGVDDKAPCLLPPELLGSIEPHAALLNVPPEGQLLYKAMSAENLVRSILGRYLHFNRVNAYSDFPGADPHDGEQLGNDRQSNSAMKFAKAPHFSIEKYYDQSRDRTYACCFSLENSDHIWKEYGDVCVAFQFGKLRATLNRTLQTGNSALIYNGTRCKQIFSVDYGIVGYVDWDSHRENVPNPIKYTYLKDRKRFSEDRELRICLSALGMGQFALADGTSIDFPQHLQLDFDFRAAIADGTIQQILYGPNCDVDSLRGELRKVGIVLRDGT